MNFSVPVLALSPLTSHAIVWTIVAVPSLIVHTIYRRVAIRGLDFRDPDPGRFDEFELGSDDVA